MSDQIEQTAAVEIDDATANAILLQDDIQQLLVGKDTNVIMTAVTLVLASIIYAWKLDEEGTENLFIKIKTNSASLAKDGETLFRPIQVDQESARQ